MYSDCQQPVPKYRKAKRIILSRLKKITIVTNNCDSIGYEDFIKKYPWRARDLCAYLLLLGKPEDFILLEYKRSNDFCKEGWNLYFQVGIFIKQWYRLSFDNYETYMSLEKYKKKYINRKRMQLPIISKNDILSKSLIEKLGESVENDSIIELYNPSESEKNFYQVFSGVTINTHGHIIISLKN